MYIISRLDPIFDTGLRLFDFTSGSRLLLAIFIELSTNGNKNLSSPYKNE